MFTETGNALLLAMRQRKKNGTSKFLVFVLSVYYHCVLFLFG